eukprot:1353-Pleurochrysis_carterae.AAC.1
MIVFAVLMDRSGLTNRQQGIVVVHKSEHQLPMFRAVAGVDDGGGAGGAHGGGDEQLVWSGLRQAGGARLLDGIPAACADALCQARQGAWEEEGAARLLSATARSFRQNRKREGVEIWPSWGVAGGGQGRERAAARVRAQGSFPRCCGASQGELWMRKGGGNRRQAAETHM